MSRIAVLGAGAWGTALAISLARRGGHQLSLWAHSPAHAEELTDSGENLRYLPGFVLPLDIRITARLVDAVESAEIILCVTPAQALRPVLEQLVPNLKSSQILLSASKGIEERTFLRMAQIAAEHAPDNPFATLGGPSFARRSREPGRRRSPSPPTTPRWASGCSWTSPPPPCGYTATKT